MIFRSKRIERVIPIQPKQPNTSYEFAKMVGRLYKIQKEPRHLILLNTKYWRKHVCNKYHISPSAANEELIQVILSQSQVNGSVIQAILDLETKANNEQIRLGEHDFIKLNRYLEIFYQNN